MSSVEQVIERFIAVFGEPKTINPALFLEEYRKALKPYRADLLEQATDNVMRTATFWPRPAEIISEVQRIIDRMPRTSTDWDAIEAERRQGWEFSDLTKAARDDASRARVQAMVDEMKRNLAAKKIEVEDPFEVDWKAVQRPAFEEMQRNSPNKALHMTRYGISQLTKRMTGDRE